MFPLLVLFISLTSNAQEVLHFEDLPALVKNRNREATAAALDLTAAEMRLGYLKRSFLPHMKGFAGQERFETGPYDVMNQPIYGIRGTVNLFRGGRDNLEERSRRADRNGSDAIAERTYQGELFDARELYWDIVYLRELRALYVTVLEHNQRNLERANKRISAGLVTTLDRLEFEISGTQLRQDLARIEVDISNHQRQLAALIGAEPETQFITAEIVPHNHDDPTANETLVFEKYRDVRLELSNQLSLESTASILKRWWVPNLELYAESVLYTFRERNFFAQRDRIDNAIGLQFTLEFDGFQQKRDGEALAARAQASGLRASQIKAETQATFNTAKQELNLLHDLIHEGEKNVKKGQEYLDMTLNEYARGIKNSPDVLGAILKNLEFRKRFAELRRDYAVVNAKLESMMAHEH